METNFFADLGDVEWPFQLVLDAGGRPIDWSLINGPIVTEAQQARFAELRRAGYRFAGMSSYMTFPRLDPAESHADHLDFEAVCEVWCHCFRDPDRYLSTAIPRELISVSDFTDYQRIAPERLARIDAGEGFDFIYAGAVESWKKETKNWRLAGKLIPRLCREMGLRALVIGSADDEFPPSSMVTFSHPLPWPEMLARLALARFLFAPNALDASPRLLAEALCLNVRLVVNRDILGGWKYVNRFTGVFFDGEGDVVAAARACLDRSLSPRDWFRANYGPYLAGKRLLRLLKSVDSGITERSHLLLDERTANSLAQA
ncbi:MAG TPA: hypothetical protein VJ810_40055 [Blastocatellia bacterium]|nr:hypothetical protein [Blastocatellia bacterium]